MKCNIHPDIDSFILFREDETWIEYCPACQNNARMKTEREDVYIPFEYFWKIVKSFPSEEALLAAICPPKESINFPMNG